MRVVIIAVTMCICCISHVHVHVHSMVLLIFITRGSLAIFSRSRSLGNQDTAVPSDDTDPTTIRLVAQCLYRSCMYAWERHHYGYDCLHNCIQVIESS